MYTKETIFYMYIMLTLYIHVELTARLKMIFFLNCCDKNLFSTCTCIEQFKINMGNRADVIGVI